MQGDATYNLSCKIILPARSTEMDAHKLKKSIMLQSVVAYRLVKGMRLFNFTKKHINLEYYVPHSSHFNQPATNCDANLV